MWSEGPWRRSPKATGGGYLRNFSLLFHPRPVSPAATHKLPYRPSGASLSPSLQVPPEGVDKGIRTNERDKGKVHSRVALASPPPPQAITLSPPIPLPTLASCKKYKTTRVALVPPQLPNLDLPGPALDEQVMARLSLAAVAPPTHVRSYVSPWLCWTEPRFNHAS